jgi:hypothetical protein
MGGSSAQLSIILSLIDNASSALAGVSENTRQHLQSIQSSADEVRNTFGLLGTAIIGGLGVLVASAANVDTAQSQLNTAVKAGINAANQDTGSTSVLSKEKANLQEQLAGVNAKLAEYEIKLNSGKAASGGYAVTIATLETKAAGLKEQLDQVTASMSLQGAQSSTLVSQFMQAAEANTNLGFSMTDSITAYAQLFRATDSVSQSLKEGQIAMDLARASNGQLDFAAAAKQVELAMEGNGRALKQYGIVLKDGLSPGEALAELQQKLAGTAQDYVNTPWGQLDVAKAKTDQLSESLGNGLIPALMNALATLTPLIVKITDWVNEHPKLTAGILMVVGVVGLLSLGISAIAGIISAGISVFLALSTVLEVVGAAVALVSLPMLIWIGVIALVIAAVALLAYEIYTHWSDIKNWTTDLMSHVSRTWSDTWTAVATFFRSMWTTLKGDIQAAISFIESLLNGLFSVVSSITSKVMAPIQAVTSAVSGIVSGIASTASSFLSVPRFASGGIVTSPTYALIGEAGPEAVIPLSAFSGGMSLAGAGGGSGGGINIYIQGGNYLDSGGATMIADAIGKQILRQLRLKNFA